jgi:hypothetical protein
MGWVETLGMDRENCLPDLLTYLSKTLCLALLTIFFSALYDQLTLFWKVIRELAGLAAQSLSHLRERQWLIVAIESSLKSYPAVLSIYTLMFAMGQRRPKFCSCLKGLLKLIELTIHHL